MSSYDLENGFVLMDKIIMKLNERGVFKEIKDVTFLVFDCQSHEDLDLIKTHPLTKNIILVGGLEVTEPTITSLTKNYWEENKEDFLGKTKNSFVIHGKPESALEETYSILSEYSKYYPFVMFYSDETTEKKKISGTGYSSHNENNFVCCINKYIKKFTSFNVDAFENIYMEESSTTKTSKNIFRKLGSGTEVPINIRKQKSPVTKTISSDDSDFSFLDGLIFPTHDMELNKYNIPTSKKWKQQFYEYLKDLLTRFFPPEKKGLVDMILTNETINNHWIPCFTHASANPNVNRNYESMESVGDKTMGYCFKFYIKIKEPSATEERMNNLDQKYMSKDFQSKLSNTMLLNKWLISDKNLTDRMDTSEDLLEALCGTIDTLLYIRKGTLGLGVIVIYNLMKLLFDNVTFASESMVSSAPDKTYVQQFFAGQAFRVITKQQYTNLRRPKEIPEKIWAKIVADMNKVLDKNDISPVIIKEDKESHRGIIEEEKLLPDGKTKITVKLMKSYADIVRTYGIKLQVQGDVILGQYISNTKKVADKMAYTRAKQFLEDHGMTKQWKDSLTEKKKSSLIQRKDIAFEKAKKKFPNLVGELTIARLGKIKINGRDVEPYQLQGIDDDGTIVPIYTVITQDSNYNQGVIDEYLSQ